MAENRHPGISMHKLPVGNGFVGVVFVVGSALIFLLGLPALWYFVVFSGALGVGIGIVLRLLNRGRSDRTNPLSILAVTEKTKRPTFQRREGRRNLFHTLPKPFSA
jgi:hypothetical protein